MTFGDRVKKIRVFRKMTMEEFGAALGFEGRNRSVRANQYESGQRYPKRDMLMKIAEVLQCNYKALDDYGLGSAEDIIETLFWLEESASINTSNKHFPEYKAPGNLITLYEMQPVSSDKDVICTYNEDMNTSMIAPVAITINYGLVNDFLLEWNKKKQELANGDITPAEYFEWKITWPHA